MGDVIRIRCAAVLVGFLSALAVGRCEAEDAMDDAVGGKPAGVWHGALYPPSWTPECQADAEGRFLHDFSYAGYRCGQNPPSKEGSVFDVVKDFGADATGTKDATAAIQSAIDAATAAAPSLVLLPKGVFRCDGMLAMKGDGVVLRGAGREDTQLCFTSFENMSNRAHLTLAGQVERGPDLFLAQDGKTRDKTVALKTLEGLAVGDEVSVGWVITQDFVKEHGMEGYWKPFYDQWKPVFRRTVIAIDAASSPASVTLDIPLRYDAKVRDQASLRKERGYLKECGIEELSVSNAVIWEDAWKQNQVHAIALDGVEDCWIRQVRSIPSPFATGASVQDKTRYHLQSSGILVRDSKRVTLEQCRMSDAQHRGSGGNGYLFEIRTSNEVLLKDCEAVRGRHNFIQNWDFGTAGCVFHRCRSAESQTVTRFGDLFIPQPAFCEFHHSLAMANLIDQCQLDDGWLAANRKSWSSGAGHTSTHCVFWNTSGQGTIKSMQYGWGYVIGTGPGMKVEVALNAGYATGSAPEDFVEGEGKAEMLRPPSLYLDQLTRRVGR